MQTIRYSLPLALMSVATAAAQTGAFVDASQSLSVPSTGSVRSRSTAPEATKLPPHVLNATGYLNSEREVWSHVWISSCTESAGTFTITTAPQHGTIRTTIEDRMHSDGCAVGSFPTVVVYYTWTETDPSYATDSFVVNLVDDGNNNTVDVDTTAQVGYKTLGPCCVGQPQAGNPISIATGNKYEQITDYETAGSNRLSFTRYYNSANSPASFAGSLGSHWRSNYDRYLRIASASIVTAERADGQVLRFTLNNGVWSTDSDVDLKLIHTGSTWTLTDFADTVETYSIVGTNEGRLASIQVRNGYIQTLIYTADNRLASVIDSYNRTLNFSYQSGLLQTLTTPDNLVFTYAYTSSGVTAGLLDRLGSVTYSTSPVTSQSYIYDIPKLPFALTGLVDENGNRFATWTYDQSGRGLTSQHGAGAELTTIAYESDGNHVTNSLGVEAVYKFAPLQGVPKMTQIDRLATASVPAAKRTFTYDSNGYVASQTDWNGNLTTYVNDIHGQPTSITEASGMPQARTTMITYHPTLHLPTKIVEPGLATSFTYDSNGNLLTRTATDTTTTTVPYLTNGVSRTSTFTWSNFLPASVQGPRTDVAELTKFTYDNSGALIAVTNALGQVTHITAHTPGGLPQTIVDPNGVTTQLTYDARLRLLSSTLTTLTGPLTTQYAYDGAGNLLTVTLPDGSALTNTYDAAHRLTGVADLFNQTIAYTLDALGDRTQINVLDATGTMQRTRSDNFDPLGRILQDIGGVGQTTAYAYDANGNSLTVTDPLQRMTQQSFDALNRRVKITDPGKGIVMTGYDAHDRPTSVTDPNGATTTYIYDGFGDLIQKTSPDSGTTVYRYDLAGNLTQSVDARAVITNFAYDALDRPISTSYPGNTAENVTLSYDEADHGFGIGRLTSVTDAAGTLSGSYDERGNVLNETRINGRATLSTSYSYDAASRIASITYPSGWIVAYGRDAMGRIASVTSQSPDGDTSLPVVSNIGYQPFGPINALTFGNGATGKRSFDPDYRLTGLADSGTNAIQNLTYGYDAANNVLSIGDGVTIANSQSFGYDTLERLTTATGAYGSLGYTYDSVGNRLTDSGGAKYSYTAKSNRLVSVTSNGKTETMGYTAAGHINTITQAGGVPTTLAYNQAGRLASVTSGSQPLTQYGYDAFGQRLYKSGSMTGVTLYQYDRSGHLLEESDGDGNPRVDYIYLGGQPIATLSPSTGQLYFFHNDRLGTPQVATDSNQTVQWMANYQPFGATSNNSNVIAQNLRLPGQQLDIETGLYHNGFRDYMPTLGRYAQSDPIGLSGGLNTFVYVANNPINRIDLIGLESLVWSLGGGAQGGVDFFSWLSGGGGGSVGVGLSWDYWYGLHYIAIPYLTDVGIVVTDTSVANYTGSGFGAAITVTACPENYLQELQTPRNSNPSKSVDLDAGELLGLIGGLHFADDGSISIDLGLGGQSLGGIGSSDNWTGVYSLRRLGNWVTGK